MRRLCATVLCLAMLHSLSASASAQDAVTSIAPARVRRLSLAQALEIASSRNLSIQRAAAAVAQARASYDTARLGLLPSALARVDYAVRSYDDVRAPAVPPDSSGALLAARQSVSGTVEVSLSLVDARGWKSISTAERGIGLAQAQERSVRQAYLLEVVRAFFLCRANQNLIALYEEQVSFAQAHLESAVAKREAGLGTSLDVLRARTEMRRVEQQLVSAQTDLSRAALELQELLALEETPRPDDSPVTVPETSLPADLQAALARRPDVAIAEQELQLSESALAQSKAGFVPSLSGSVTGTYQPTSPAVSPTGEPYLVTAGVSLTIPLFDPLVFANIGPQKATCTEKRLALEEARRRGRNEIDRAVLAIQAARSNVMLAQEQASLAQAALEEADILHKVGKASSLEVIDATRALEEAKASQVARQLDLEVARAELVVALGIDILSAATGR